MTHHFAPDLHALAAKLRLIALGLLAELMELVGLGALAAGLRRRIGRDLAGLERLATGVVVLMALKTLPPPLPEQGSGVRRPFNAPHGFRRIATDAHEMRAMQRKLFPRLRDLRARLARFDAVLDDARRAAARLARHIMRIPPASRLVAIAPPALVLAACAMTHAVAADDSS